MANVLLGLVLLISACAMVSAQSRYDQRFLEDIYRLNPGLLSSLNPPWSSVATDACGNTSISAWQGIRCTTTEPKMLEELWLPNVFLNLSLPNSIADLNALKTLYVALDSHV